VIQVAAFFCEWVSNEHRDQDWEDAPMRNSILAIITLLCLGVASAAQQPPTIQQVSIKRSSWASGQQMYHEYCAACHGENAKGGGPAAAACVVKPPDLTTLAKKNDGKFPYNYFYSVLQFGKTMSTPAHGSADMPIWMPLFLSLGNADQEAIAQQRTHNLARYIASLQSK
jgi:mono/diheme cytochrome c family protein